MQYEKKFGKKHQVFEKSEIYNGSVDKIFWALLVKSKLRKKNGNKFSRTFVEVFLKFLMQNKLKRQEKRKISLQWSF